MRDTGGKSGRRPGRHLQVEASGLGNAAGVQQTDACATERENCRSIEGYSPLRTCLNTALAVFVSVWAVPSGAACVGYRYQEATIAYERLAPLLAADGTTAVVLAKSSSVCA